MFIPSPMLDLYLRLKSVSFDSKFVKETVLPEWWEDSLAEVPFNRSVAEAALASHLGFGIELLSDPNAPLPPPTLTGVLFKRNRNVSVEKTLASLQVVRRAADLVTYSLSSTQPPLANRLSASEVRKNILDRGESVNLKSLLQFCWSAEIAVIHVSKFPTLSNKFDGVAMCRGGRPVIALTSGRDGPPWLAFYLAHELGHVMLGHVSAANDTIVDSKLNSEAEDELEIAADQFACELLTGDRKGLQFTPTYGLKGAGLARAALRYVKEADTVIDAGILCLFYCSTAKRWGVAQQALEELQQEVGGREMVTSAMRAHLDTETYSDSELRFLDATCGGLARQLV